jgi:peptidoglycan/xylan/chitin deacetylase (PgdA/CDA1 family)
VIPWRGLFSLMSPAGDAARLSIFIFHRVLPEPDPLFPDAVDVRRFDQIVGWLRGWFNILPLDSAVAHLKARSLPARAAAITFDDGYEDNHSLALPVLRGHEVTATFFIATGFLDGGRMWNDSVIESVRRCRMPRLDLGHLGLDSHALDSMVARRAAIASIIGQIKYRAPEQRHQLTSAIADAARAVLPDDLMMTSSQVRAMHQAGMQIGAHTVAHPILARVDEHTARREMAESRDALQSITGSRVGLFAYPNGKPGVDYLQEHVQMVEALGFDAAVSTGWGAAAAGSNLFQIPRFTPWDSARWRFGLRALRNFAAPDTALRVAAQEGQYPQPRRVDA